MTVHVVQAGDTLWNISQQYQVPIETIQLVNGLRSTLLIPGLALYVPNEGSLPRNHQVKVGESLWLLARQYNTTIEAIITANADINLEPLLVGQRLLIPSSQPLIMKTLGFIMPYSTQMEKFDEIADQLTYLAIVSYSLTEKGYAYVELEDNLIVQRSLERNVTPLLMIRNLADGEFSPQLIGQVLENENYRNNLIQSMMNFVEQKGYGGISIDFEFIPPAQRLDFIQFLDELKGALGARVLHVNVHAKTVDIPTNPIIGGYDYEAIGAIADYIGVMTMDYGYPGGPPDPVSPFWWMEQVIQYSVNVIPPEKIQIGLPLYGYEWPLGTNLTLGRSLLDAQTIAIETGAIIHFDSYARVPFYYYWRGREGRIVWFDDIRSYLEKYRLVDLYQLNGATYWHINLSFPQNWAYLRQHVAIVKL
ncbi:glycosyl hydrolase family 18 protein [Bacillus solitudinis]|uniref:glycosyl hydrolase family 18 protein n=1 Tax=Bacillus solitudinis TaxID=2014074 RepID=UPI000C245B8C|nr:glycosyl hydrolase family 18 protein [Bacillus solitudinis]